MNGEWCYFKSYINKNLCEKIISDSMSIPAHDGNLGVSGANVDYSMRKSMVRFINSNDTKFSYLFDIIWKTAISANSDFFNIHITKLDFIQVAEYDQTYQGEYKEHHDVFWVNNSQYHRKLSCIIQLSDPKDYEGGDFVITDTITQLDSEIKEQGSIIYFPSMLRHKANPVTKGTRYSIAAWFEGPEWR